MLHVCDGHMTYNENTCGLPQTIQYEKYAIGWPNRVKALPLDRVAKSQDGTRITGLCTCIHIYKCIMYLSSLEMWSGPCAALHTIHH